MFALNRCILYSFIPILLTITSCDPNRIYDENQSIDNSFWSIDDVKKYDVEIEDTISSYNFYVNVRHIGSYQRSNLFIFIKTIFPNNKFAMDTIECVLADEKGKWYGKGIGDLKDNRILFKKGLKFPIKGSYSFYLQHGMRKINLEGIKDIGIRIEKQ